MEKPKVIIVGGGLSGIAAAQRLFTKGFTNLQILEAKNRFGGRILTQKYGEGHIDMGAQWIHGEGDNPVHILAKSHGFVHDSTIASGKINLFYTQRGALIPTRVSNMTCAVLDDILEDANQFSRDAIPLCDDDADSVGKYARRAFDQYLHQCNDNHEVRMQKQAIFQWRMLYEKSDNGSKSADELSLYSWGQYTEYDGDNDVVLNRGYGPIIDVLLRDVPSQRFKLNSTVEHIDWHTPTVEKTTIGNLDDVHKRQIKVSLKCGERMSTEYADYVIVTCSLGVLKARAHQLFSPPLHKQKMSAINNICFGFVNKIYIEFDKPFWDKNCEGIQLAWLSNDEQFHLNCLDNRHIEQYGEWYKAIHSFDTVDFQPNLLCGWISGEEAYMMEGLSETLVASVCVELLQRFTGNLQISQPQKITRTRWGSDPDILGSYSYIQTKHTADDCDVLMEPLPSEQNPCLLFAGEATDKEHFSTTHGALLSGQREADRIIKIHNNYSKPKL